MLKAASKPERRHTPFRRAFWLLVASELSACQAYDADLIDSRRPAGQVPSSVVVAGRSAPLTEPLTPGTPSAPAPPEKQNEQSEQHGLSGQSGLAAAGSGGKSQPAHGGAAGVSYATLNGNNAGTGGVGGGAAAGQDNRAGSTSVAADAPTCGDGQWQTSSGETCDPSSSAAGAACPTAAQCADTDPCTRDSLTGSSATCDAACRHEAITTPMNGDGCCPAGANATNDTDCQPKCGNGLVEGNEECDGTATCDSHCKLRVLTEAEQCLAKYAVDDCERCECMNCTDEFLACRASGNSQRDELCSAVELCAAENNCSGQACYCGGSGGITLDCALRPRGPCRTQIEVAAGSSLSLVIDAQYRDRNSALGRAGALGECRRQHCAAACR